ncbi:MAG: ATP-binding cassette domain-containing protein [Candidatus Moraniibacteriota bacterium]
MLTVKNIRKNQGGETVLKKVSFSIGEGQKVALVGENGVGKSTLLSILAGVETADRGQILLPNRVLIGFLAQEILAESTETLNAYLRRAAGLTALEEEMESLRPHLPEPHAQERFDRALASYERLGGHEFGKRSHRVLQGLHVKDLGSDRVVDTLSGGERRKVALAGALLSGADLLLLDEPTNNLDAPALKWLEGFLHTSKATVLVASHDRTFLDAVVTKVLEIDRAKRETTMHNGNWSNLR